MEHYCSSALLRGWTCPSTVSSEHLLVLSPGLRCPRNKSSKHQQGPIRSLALMTLAFHSAAVCALNEALANVALLAAQAVIVVWYDTFHNCRFWRIAVHAKLHCTSSGLCPTIPYSQLNVRDMNFDSYFSRVRRRQCLGFWASPNGVMHWNPWGWPAPWVIENNANRQRIETCF